MNERLEKKKAALEKKRQAALEAQKAAAAEKTKAAVAEQEVAQQKEEAVIDANVADQTMAAKQDTFEKTLQAMDGVPEDEKSKLLDQYKAEMAELEAMRERERQRSDPEPLAKSTQVGTEETK